MTFAPARSATDAVSSSEASSTTMTSTGPAAISRGIAANASPTSSALLRAGTTTLTTGALTGGRLVFAPMAGEQGMGRFWDERAKENALYFVDSRLDYNATDADRFWADGLDTFDKVLEIGGTRVQQGDTVVDIGCGVGRLSRAAVERGAGRVIGVDVSAEMVRQAQELNAGFPTIEFHHGDGQHLTGVPDAVADAVVSHVVFQHIPDPQITLGYVREMGRVLKPGGWAVFQVSNDPAIHQAKPTGLSGAIRRMLGREPKGRDNAAWLGSAIDLDELQATANDADMDVEHIEGAGTQFCIVRLRRR